MSNEQQNQPEGHAEQLLGGGLRISFNPNPHVDQPEQHARGLTVREPVNNTLSVQIGNGSQDIFRTRSGMPIPPDRGVQPDDLCTVAGQTVSVAAAVALGLLVRHAGGGYVPNESGIRRFASDVSGRTAAVEQAQNTRAVASISDEQLADMLSKMTKEDLAAQKHITLAAEVQKAREAAAAAQRVQDTARRMAQPPQAPQAQPFAGTPSEGTTNPEPRYTAPDALRREIEASRAGIDATKIASVKERVVGHVLVGGVGSQLPTIQALASELGIPAMAANIVARGIMQEVLAPLVAAGQHAGIPHGAVVQWAREQGLQDEITDAMGSAMRSGRVGKFIALAKQARAAYAQRANPIQ
jgi:hypothetical protein